jgi:hypothetical protein
MRLMPRYTDVTTYSRSKKPRPRSSTPHLSIEISRPGGRIRTFTPSSSTNASRRQEVHHGFAMGARCHHLFARRRVVLEILTDFGVIDRHLVATDVVEHIRIAIVAVKVIARIAAAGAAQQPQEDRRSASPPAPQVLRHSPHSTLGTSCPRPLKQQLLLAGRDRNGFISPSERSNSSLDVTRNFAETWPSCLSGGLSSRLPSAFHLPGETGT